MLFKDLIEQLKNNKVTEIIFSDIDFNDKDTSSPQKLDFSNSQQANKRKELFNAILKNIRCVQILDKKSKETKIEPSILTTLDFKNINLSEPKRSTLKFFNYLFHKQDQFKDKGKNTLKEINLTDTGLNKERIVDLLATIPDKYICHICKNIMINDVVSVKPKNSYQKQVDNKLTEKKSCIMYDCADTTKDAITKLAEGNGKLVCFWVINNKGILIPAKGSEEIAQLLLDNPNLQKTCWQILVSGKQCKILEEQTTKEKEIENKYSLLKFCKNKKTVLHNYHRDCIEEWFKHSKTNPMTNEEVDTQLTSNDDLCKKSRKFLANNPKHLISELEDAIKYQYKKQLTQLINLFSHERKNIIKEGATLAKQIFAFDIETAKLFTDTFHLKVNWDDILYPTFTASINKQDNKQLAQLIKFFGDKLKTIPEITNNGKSLIEQIFAFDMKAAQLFAKSIELESYWNNCLHTSLTTAINQPNARQLIQLVNLFGNEIKQLPEIAKNQNNTLIKQIAQFNRVIALLFANKLENNVLQNDLINEITNQIKIRNFKQQVLFIQEIMRPFEHRDIDSKLGALLFERILSVNWLIALIITDYLDENENTTAMNMLNSHLKDNLNDNTLDLMDCEIFRDEPFAKKITQILDKNTNITKIDNYYVANNSSNDYYDALNRNKILYLASKTSTFEQTIEWRNTEMSSCTLGFKSCTAIAEVLKNPNNKATMLDLSTTNGRSSQCIKVIAETLKNNKTVKIVFLHSIYNRGNIGLDTDGVNALLEMLQTNTTITELKLTYDNAVSKELKDKINGLICRNKIELLFNDLKDQTLHIRDILSVQDQDDSVNERKISTENIQLIADKISKNTTIKTIVLSSNQFDDQGVSKIIASLKNNKTVTHLSFINDNINYQSMSAIIKLLKYNTTLQRLFFSSQQMINIETAEKLLAALENNTTLTELRIAGIPNKKLEIKILDCVTTNKLKARFSTIDIKSHVLKFESYLYIGEKSAELIKDFVTNHPNIHTVKKVIFTDECWHASEDAKKAIINACKKNIMNCLQENLDNSFKENQHTINLTELISISDQEIHHIINYSDQEIDHIFNYFKKPEKSFYIEKIIGLSIDNDKLFKIDQRIADNQIRFKANWKDSWVNLKEIKFDDTNVPTIIELLKNNQHVTKLTLAKKGQVCNKLSRKSLEELDKAITSNINKQIQDRFAKLNDAVINFQDIRLTNDNVNTILKALSEHPKITKVEYNSDNISYFNQFTIWIKTCKNAKQTTQPVSNNPNSLNHHIDSNNETQIKITRKPT